MDHDAGDEGNRYLESYGPVFLRLGRVMLSSVIAEEGHGIIYFVDYYWRRARKHVAVIFFVFCIVTTRRWGIFAAGKIVEGEL